MGPNGCPETFINNCQRTLRNRPEERRPQIFSSKKYWPVPGSTQPSIWWVPLELPWDKAVGAWGLTAHLHLLPRLRISEAIYIPPVCFPLFIFTPLQYDRQYFPMKLIHTYSGVGMFTVLPAGWSNNEFRFPIGIMMNFSR